MISNDSKLIIFEEQPEKMTKAPGLLKFEYAIFVQFYALEVS